MARGVEGLQQQQDPRRARNSTKKPTSLQDYVAHARNLAFSILNPDASRRFSKLLLLCELLLCVFIIKRTPYTEIDW